MGSALILFFLTRNNMYGIKNTVAGTSGDGFVLVQLVYAKLKSAKF